MATVEFGRAGRPLEVVVHHAEDVSVTAEQVPVAAGAPNRTRGGGAPGRGAPADPLADPLRAAGFELAASVSLRPTASSRSTRGPEEPTRIHVRVAAAEGAILLVEGEGGVFAWLQADAATGRRETRAGTPPEFVFTIPRPDAAGGDRDTRGGGTDWLIDVVTKPARILVLKFVVRLTIDAAVNRIEGDNPTGLVAIRDLAPGTWRPGPVDVPAARTDRPVTVLLLVHGTFSSTAGSFGDLALRTEGRAFLKEAIQAYDLVVGFDHKTLAVDVETNAEQLADALSALPRGAAVDCVAFSRGGLVYRTLAERLMAARRPDIEFRRAVFVGCANGGTHLAHPANWEALADLYTNVLISGARLAAALTGASAFDLLVHLGLKTVGEFVQLLPQVAIADRRVPGLASMFPDGQTVRRLNGTATAGRTQYFAITSEFDPGRGVEAGLSRQLRDFLVRRVTRTLWEGEANDLVVDTRSMTSFAEGQAPAGRAIHAFGANGIVHHTVYFASQKTATMLAAWLENPLPEPSPPEPSPAKPPPTEPLPIESPERTAPSPANAPDPDSFLADDDLDEEMLTLGIGDAAPAAERVPKAAPAAPPPAEVREGRLLRGERGLDASPGGERARGRQATRDVRSAAVPAPDVVAPRGAPGPIASEAHPAADASEAELHMAASMPEAPALHEVANLEVTLSRDTINLPAGSTGGLDSRLAETARKLTVCVVAQSNCEVVGTSRAEVAFPPPGRPETLVYQIRGLRAGVAEVAVDVFQDVRRLSRIVLQPSFAAGSRIATRASVRANEVDRPIIHLRIFEDFTRGGFWKLRFVASSVDLDIDDVHETAEIDVEKQKYLADLYKRLEDAWSDTDNGFDAMTMQMQALGTTLFRRLFPIALQRTIWAHRDRIGSVQVFSYEPSIPWEVAFIGDPDAASVTDGRFLAELGLVRWISNAAGLPPTRVRLRHGKALHCYPDYVDQSKALSGAAAEATLLSTLLGARRLEAHLQPVAAALSRSGGEDFDLLHFTCHGSAEIDRIWNAGLLLSGHDRGGVPTREELSVDIVEAHADLARDGRRPIVFLNACRSAAGGQTLGGAGGLAQAFVRKGAGLLVGTQWSIGDRPALGFCETFYRELLAGRSLAQAAAAARQRGKRDRDSTWLAYAFYGHPYARIDREPSGDT